MPLAVAARPNLVTVDNTETVDVLGNWLHEGIAFNQDLYLYTDVYEDVSVWMITCDFYSTIFVEKGIGTWMDDAIPLFLFTLTHTILSKLIVWNLLSASGFQFYKDGVKEFKTLFKACRERETETESVVNNQAKKNNNLKLTLCTPSGTRNCPLEMTFVLCSSLDIGIGDNQRREQP